ncbi:MAG: CapA family protein [bacterium]|nr:CapA family protein [Candidatus Aquidulcis sp.]
MDLPAVTDAPSPRRRSIFTLALALLLAAACGTSAAPSGSIGDPSSSPSITPAADTRSPLIPVAGYRSTLTALTSGGIARLAEVGGTIPITKLVLISAEATPILAALGLSATAIASRLSLVADRAALKAALAVDEKAAGFVRLAAIEPALRTLTWEGAAIVGVNHIATLAEWPLRAELPPDTSIPAEWISGPQAYDPATAWTLAAGGDILLDRGVSADAKRSTRGADSLFDGGFADITGTTCCSQFGVPRVAARYVRDGGVNGLMRSLFQNADLSIANLESPTPKKWRQHNSGTTFTGNPALLRVLKEAGIDFLSLANNHIGDGGVSRIPETIAAVKAAGMGSGGAGANLAEAQRPWLTNVGGVTVGIVAVDQVNPSTHARVDRAGSAPIGVLEMRASIAAARAAGADVVIVFPHWGLEFQAHPTASQRRFAKRAIEAGADMILGSHSHWASAMEIINDKPVFYSMGNFIFDQNWSVETAQGLVIESTFAGSRLVSTRMLPTVILRQSQPNFVDVATDGVPIMNRVWKGSKGLPRW